MMQPRQKGHLTKGTICLGRPVINWCTSSLALITIAAICLWLGVAVRTSSCSLEESRLASGLIHLSSWDFMVFTVNPPLPRMTAAIPAYFGGAKTVDRRELGTLPHVRTEFAAGVRFLEDNAEDYHTNLLAARVALLLFSLTGVFISFAWAANEWGNTSGLWAAAIWVVSPYVLAHGSIVSPDVPAAAMACVSVYCFWKWLKTKDWGAAGMAGLVLGLAELCKFTLLVFYPMFLVMWLGYRMPESRGMTVAHWRRQFGQLVAIYVISVCVINGGYLFEKTCMPLDSFRFQTTMFTGCKSLDDVPESGANRFAGTWLGKVPVPLPASMIQGIDTQRYDFERGVPSYLRGQWADHGWWYYYPYALLVKMPLGTWGLLCLAVFATFLLKGYNGAWRDEMVVLLPPVTLLLFVGSQTGFSVHSRYIIPTLPFLFIWISKVGKAFTAEHHRNFPRSTLAVRCLAVLFLGWMIVSSMAVYPHSLSYFNELAAAIPTPYDDSYLKPIELTSSDAREGRESFLSRVHNALTIGPRHGPRHLLDSNIDWGQDLFYLEDWYERHPEARPFHVVYWGQYPLELSALKSASPPPIGPDADYPTAGVPANELGPKPGWHAISVNRIYDRSGLYRYFLGIQPVASAGYSIYIYHITFDEANRVRRELGLSELPQDRK